MNNIQVWLEKRIEKTTDEETKGDRYAQVWERKNRGQEFEI